MGEIPNITGLCALCHPKKKKKILIKANLKIIKIAFSILSSVVKVTVIVIFLLATMNYFNTGYVSNHVPKSNKI